MSPAFAAAYYCAYVKTRDAFLRIPRVTYADWQPKAKTQEQLREVLLDHLKSDYDHKQ